MEQGKFIVFAGPNGVGKTHQLDKLERYLKEVNIPLERIKFPQYQGPVAELLNLYLRGGNPHELDPKGFQLLTTLDRWYAQPKLHKILESGVNILAEDYTITGLVWGGVTIEDSSGLPWANEGLLEPDLCIVFDGERFSTGHEKGHTHESHQSLIDRARREFKIQANKAMYCCEMINANQPIESVHQDILKLVCPILGIE